MIQRAYRWIRTASALCAAVGVFACRPAPQPAAPGGGPRLVVLMSIDQMRADLLYGYSPVFTGGLRRLLDEGFAFDNAVHDHAFTETAPGHHTLSTGVYPSRTGVVANTWSERDGDGWKSVYAVEDLGHPILGYPDLPGRGPANNARAGIADWMLARDPDTRVVAVSRKDRAAIGLAAQARGDVSWIADRGGEFITSDFYHDRYPHWVTRFNRSRMPELYSQTEWDSELPEAAAAWTRPDTSRWELDGEHTWFPHRASDLVDANDPGALNHWRYEFTPFPDAAVLAFSEEAIDQLELGRRESVDFLGISLSQTDLVGHHFGPMSREQLDNLVKLDRELGEFFDYLDREVGPGQWVLAFSADHGVLDIPEQLADDGVPAARLGRDDRARFIEAVRGAQEGGPDAVKDAIERLPFVAAAYTFEEIESGQVADSFAILYAHSHSRTRAPQLSARWGVYTRFTENTLVWGSNRATHGSPYEYDRDVPIVFLGAGVGRGRSSERVATVDVAPTLARLAGIAAPDDLDGHVLESALAP